MEKHMALCMSQLVLAVVVEWALITFLVLVVVVLLELLLGNRSVWTGSLMLTQTMPALDLVCFIKVVECL